MNTYAEDRDSVQTINYVLPMLVFGLHHAEKGGALDVLLDATYDRLLDLRMVLVDRMGRDESVPHVATQRHPASQWELMRRLENYVGRVLVHELCSGEVKRELMSFYLAVVAMLSRRAS
jgi:hypothetical protein